MWTIKGSGRSSVAVIRARDGIESRTVLFAAPREEGSLERRNVLSGERAALPIEKVA
jgi:hypothetical protein